MEVIWKGKRVFEAASESGATFVMDAYLEAGGQGLGPAPLEAFITSGAACSAMDVLSILEKKRQVITSYRVEVDGVRASEGPYPRPYTSLTFRHIIAGENLDEHAVAQAVELSHDKYCTVIATLRQTPEIDSIFEIESPAEIVIP